MIKRLSFLLFIIAFASTVNAALELDIEVGGVDYAGEILAYHTPITVKIVETGVAQTTGTGGTFFVSVRGYHPGWHDTTGTPYYYNQIIPPYPDAGHFTRGGWDWASNNVGFEGGDFKVSKIAATAGNTPGIPGTDTIYAEESFDYGFTWTTLIQGPPIAEYTFLLLEGDTVVSFKSGSWNGVSVSGSETIHEVPEPITIALLGLGGLLMRRRK